MSPDADLARVLADGPPPRCAPGYRLRGFNAIMASLTTEELSEQGTASEAHPESIEQSNEPFRPERSRPRNAPRSHFG